MVKGATTGCYESGPSFEEIKEEAMLDTSPTDPKEFWLMQWPKYKGFLLSYTDGNLGALESSSGKSYELVSFASQRPDTTVFLPSESETKAGSSRKTMSWFTGTSKNRSSQGSALSLGALSIEPTPKHKKRKDESSLEHSNVPGKASEGSQAHGAESNTATEMPQTTPEKSKKKKKVKITE